jgi:hypothetical protein
MVRFRSPASGQIRAFILHPVRWLAAQRRLLRSIQHWRAASTAMESTSINGFNRVAGQPVRNPTIALAARACLFSGGVTLVAALSAVWNFRTEWWCVGYALGFTACACASMFLPAMLYRPPLLPSELEPPSGPN